MSKAAKRLKKVLPHLAKHHLHLSKLNEEYSKINIKVTSVCLPSVQGACRRFSNLSPPPSIRHPGLHNDTLQNYPQPTSLSLENTRPTENLKIIFIVLIIQRCPLRIMHFD